MIRIPAIDLINGTCVRLTKGEFDASTTYDLNPVDVALSYEKAGATHIHIVDLDAARGKGSNKNVILDIQRETDLRIQTGGGIRSRDQIVAFFEAGIESVIIGSLAQKNRSEVKKWVQEFGSDRIIIGADVRNKKIAVDGWLSTSNEHITDFIMEYKSAGARKFLCTDIQKDGTLSGTSNKLYKSLIAKFPDIELIASGGVATLKDLLKLDKMGVHSCVIGKALFEGKINVEELFANK